MPIFNPSSTDFDTQVVSVMRQLLDELCISEAQASVLETIDDQGNHFVLVKPQSAQAASIHLHFFGEAGLIDFSFGSSLSMFELDGDGYMERLRMLAKAVMQGMCGETKGFIAHTSWLEPIEEGRRIGSSTFFYPRLWPIKRKFEPYST